MTMTRVTVNLQSPVSAVLENFPATHQIWNSTGQNGQKLKFIHNGAALAKHGEDFSFHNMIRHW
jgi:hypothetical protein